MSMTMQIFWALVSASMLYGVECAAGGAEHTQSDVVRRFKKCAIRTAHEFTPRPQDARQGATSHPAGRGKCDVVHVSEKHRFMLVQNQRAASSVFKGMIYAAFTGVNHPLGAQSPLHRCESCRRKLKFAKVTSCLLPREWLRDFFKYSHVRDPLARFVSGLHQARISNATNFANITFESAMARMTDSYGGWGDSHLESSLFKLSPYLDDGRPVDLDFIATTENIVADVDHIARHMHNITHEQRKIMLAFAEASARGDATLPRAAINKFVNGGSKPRGRLSRLPADFTMHKSSPQEQLIPHTHTERHSLPLHLVRKFCMFRRQEYECLNYEQPLECRDQDSDAFGRPSPPY